MSRAPVRHVRRDVSAGSASDDAGMVTGASYTMDGGWSAR